MIVQNNYRVFSTPEMLVRTKVILQILEAGGYVRGVAYKGHALLARIPRKEIEELTEVGNAYRDTGVIAPLRWRARILEECADVAAITALGLRLYKRPESSALKPSVPILRNRWVGLMVPTTPSDHDLELHKDRVRFIGVLLTETKQGLVQWMQRKEMAFTTAELDTAIEDKRARAGDFEGLAITRVALPEGSRWIDKFAGNPKWKPDVLMPDDITNSLNHDMINAVTLKR